MAAVTDSGAATEMTATTPEEIPARPARQEIGDLLAGLGAAALAGAALAAAARSGATALLIVVAVLQAALAVAWLLGTGITGTGMPGRWGTLVLAGLAAAGADVAVSVSPHDRLGALAPVLGLLVPALFVHQLLRGAARVRIVESISATAFLALAQISLPAFAQLRHEFQHPAVAAGIVAATSIAVAGALTASHLVDAVLPVPRVDPTVRRGLSAVVAAGIAGGVLGVALLPGSQYSHAHAGSVGAVLGALAGLLALGATFVAGSAVHSSVAGWVARTRSVLSALLPMHLLAPLAFLLCLSLRS